MRISSQEVAAVLAAPPHVRYAHFCKQAVATDAIWYLRVDGAPLHVRHEGAELLALWSAREFAEAAMRPRWPAGMAMRLDLDSWIFGKLPRMRSQGVDAAIMMDATGHGQRSTAGELMLALEAQSRRLLAAILGAKGDPLEAWHDRQKMLAKAGPDGRLR